MDAQPPFNRWFVVVGAILIQLALGAIYAWSVFTALLTDPAGPYAFSASETAWVFSAGLATFAIVMVMAGRWLPKIGPRSLAVSGGLLLGAGLPWYAGRVYGFEVPISAASVAVAFVVSVGVGIFFGLYPARRAANMNLVDALSYD